MCHEDSKYNRSSLHLIRGSGRKYISVVKLKTCKEEFHIKCSVASIAVPKVLHRYQVNEVSPSATIDIQNS